MQATQVMQAMQDARPVAGERWSWPPRRYVITNQKGGQGKTTTTVELGAVLAARGASVRIVDVDPQIGSATYWLPPQGYTAGEGADLSHVLLAQAGLDDATWPTTVPGLFIVPSYHTAAQFEAIRPPGADVALREAIDDARVFDVTLIDCPPNLGLLTVTAITAADDVIIPCRPGGLDLAGVSDLNQTLALVKRRLNPALHVSAVVVCGKLRSNLASAVEQQLAVDYPEAVHQTIRHAVTVSEAPTVGQPLQQYAPRATAAADYRALAEALYPRGSGQ